MKAGSTCVAGVTEGRLKKLSERRSSLTLSIPQIFMPSDSASHARKIIL